jgi:hypothetical protein
MISAGIGTVATKAAAGLAAAAIVTAGAVEVKQVSHPRPHHVVAAQAPVAAVQPAVPEVVSSTPQPTAPVKHRLAGKDKRDAKTTAADPLNPLQNTTTTSTSTPLAQSQQPQPGTTDQGGSTVTLPQQGAGQLPQGSTEADPAVPLTQPQPAGTPVPPEPVTSTTTTTTPDASSTTTTTTTTTSSSGTIESTTTSTSSTSDESSTSDGSSSSAGNG